MFEVKDGDVFIVKEIITKTQTAVTKNYYDKEFHTKLSYSNSIVTAQVYNYLNEFQETYNDLVTFELSGQVQEVQAVNGVAEIEFSSEVSGEYVIKTSIPNFRNGEVIIHVE